MHHQEKVARKEKSYMLVIGVCIYVFCRFLGSVASL
jgi:hypothetical protein